MNKFDLRNLAPDEVEELANKVYAPQGASFVCVTVRDGDDEVSAISDLLSRWQEVL